MAVGVGRSFAPGVTVYESAIASTAGAASFNTVYMLVDAPDETSVTVFPLNRPIAISSLNEYENLIETLPTSGPELMSYYSVKAFFQQVTNPDLRVLRVGTPGVIQSLAFNPGSNKDDGVTAPSELQKGDLVYLKLLVNGIQLGDTATSGAWLGVPVTIPANYVDGDVDNNLAISNAMRDAVVEAIGANADISAGAYIRETGSGDPACAECSYLFLTGRVFNTQVELLPSTQVTGNQYVMSAAAYDIDNVTAADQSVHDWIQAVNTGFEDSALPQGYMLAPSAFAIYNQADRVNLGQTMESICGDANHRWMAMVDCGPYDVTSIVDYSDYIEHDPADGFDVAEKALIQNVIYEWTFSAPLRFTQAKYVEGSEAGSTNSSLELGDRRALKDDRYLYVTVANALVPPVTVATDVVTLDSSWPTGLTSGERVEIEATYVADVAGRPVLPTFNDTPTGAVASSLTGTFYVIASDIDPNLAEDEIKLATSRTRALNDETIDFVTAGTAGTGGVLLDIQYATVDWRFDVTIKGKTSDLVEVNNSDGASFNTLHLPGTLQKPTESHDFRSQVRRLSDPSRSIYRGGGTTKYFSAATVTDAVDTITFNAHGLNTGDEVNLTVFPGGELAAGLTSGSLYYAIVVDDNTVAFANSVTDAENDVRITFTGQGTDSTTVQNPSGAPAQGILTTGSDALIMSADHGLKTADVLYFNADIDSSTDQVFAGSTATSAVPYYVWVEDRNFFRLALSSSNLASEVFRSFPVSPDVVTTATAVDWYRNMTTTVSGGNFSDIGIVRFLRGRKYQIDATLAVFNVKDESGTPINTGNLDYTTASPGVPPSNFLYDLTTDLRLSAVTAPVGGAEHQVAAADVDFANDFINLPAHGYTLGQAVVLSTAVGATLPVGLEEDVTYFVSGPSGGMDANNVALSETLAEAIAGTFITLTDGGLDGTAGFEFVLTVDSQPFTYQYTEDEIARPLNNSRDFAGSENYYTVPLSSGVQADSGSNFVYAHTVLETNPQPGAGAKPIQLQTLFHAELEVEYVESNATPPNSIWNFDAVSSQDLADESLRGVNNNGIAQMVVIEKGLDSHSRLFEESQYFSSTQGFLAYYAPYMLNDVGVYVPPTPFVTGLAMKRYRDEVAGFRLPPAGAKYQLNGARGVEVEITTGMQNVSNPYGLNALRQLPGYSNTDPDTGITYGPVFVWGSRTRVNPANAEQALYKFVNTRVIMNVIFGTLSRALDQQIFNIVDGRAVTFNQIRTLVANTLYENFYVPGALFGSTAADAFDVICDDRNNPGSYLEDGLVNVQVFVVPVPTLERIEIDLLRVSIGNIGQVQRDLGYEPFSLNRV